MLHGEIAAECPGEEYSVPGFASSMRRKGSSGASIDCILPLASTSMVTEDLVVGVDWMVFSAVTNNCDNPRRTN